MTKRTYKQACSLALALDVIGERWTLLIVRELLTGAKRYGELMDNLPGMGTNLLAARLKDMEEQDLIERVEIDGGASAYELTGSGRGLESVVHSLIRWGMAQGLQAPRDALHRASWDAVAIKALLGRIDDLPLHCRVALVLDGKPFKIEVTEDGIGVMPGPTINPESEIHINSSAANAISRGEVTIKEAEHSGFLTINGKKLVARRILKAMLHL